MAVAPDPAGVPSPQFQACPVTRPPVSVEPLPSTATVRSLPVAVNDALGAVLVGRPVVPRLKWLATLSADSTVG